MSIDRDQHEQPPASGDGPLHAASDATVEVPLPPSGDPDEVRRWALAVMASFGLAKWKFEFTKGIRTLGVCRYQRRVIGLSRHLIEPNHLEQTRDTLLHKCAHALVGSCHGH